MAALTRCANGVVYGDIGTSVPYAMKDVFGSGNVPLAAVKMVGILSTFFWSLPVTVSLSLGQRSWTLMPVVTLCAEKEAYRDAAIITIFGQVQWRGSGARRLADL